MSKHIPVLLDEVLELMSPQQGENLIDCTFGAGGHSLAINDKIRPDGKILGIEADKQTAESYRPANKNIILINDNFVNLKEIYERSFPYPVNLVLFDLGLSSMELDSSGRGFSFRFNEPLDMRFNPQQQRLTAAEVVNKYGQHKLAELFIAYGDVPPHKARQVSKAIIRSRGGKRIVTTYDLIKVIFSALHPKLIKAGELDIEQPVLFAGRPGRVRIHPATKFFQALRIEVNNELENLRQALPQAFEILSVGGRLGVIAFHSLEDRIVKQLFKTWAAEGRGKLLTKKPVAPSVEEIKNNPRSRSAKLRVIIKL